MDEMPIYHTQKVYWEDNFLRHSGDNSEVPKSSSDYDIPID